MKNESLSEHDTFMRRILFITPKLYGGGAEKVTAMLASAMAEENKVWLLNLREETHEDYPVSPKVKMLFMPPITVPPQGNMSEMELKAEYIRNLKKKLRITASVSFLEEANFYNVRSKRDDSVIVSVRNSYREKYGWPIRDVMEAWRLTEYIGLSNKIVAISQGIADEIDSMWPGHKGKISVIYNPVDVKELERLAGEPLNEELTAFMKGSRVITNFGRLVEQKGQLHLIRAFSKVASRIPDTKLVIAGKGPLEDTLREEIASLSLQTKVLLAGRLDNPYPLLKASYAFVLSSIYEGLSNSLIESGALGVPMISSDCPYGPREIIAGDSDYTKEVKGFSHEKYGLLTQRLTGDSLRGEDALREAMIYMLSDEGAREQYALLSKERGNDYDAAKILKQWYPLLPNGRRFG